MSYSIGYSEGICYTGEDLRKDIDDLVMYPPIIIAANLYSLHNVELGVIYPLGDGKGIEVGVGYGWARIEDANGWSVFKNDFIDTLDGYLDAKFKKINVLSIWISLTPTSFLRYRIEVIGLECKGFEYFWVYPTVPPFVPEKHNVFRLCWGGAVFFKLEGKGPKIFFWKFIPYLGLRVGMTWEVYASSPWKEEWNRKLKVPLTGIYLGFKLLQGGKK